MGNNKIKRYKNLIFKQKKEGFTLAENMIVFAVLGVILVLALPKIIHFQSETAKQLLLRKSVANYQIILTRELMNSTGIFDTDDFNTYLEYDSYSSIVNKFAVKQSECYASSCTFITDNGVLWNVSTPSAAIISLNSYREPTIELAKDMNNTDVFVVPFEVIDGNLKMLLTKDNDLSTALNKTTTFKNGD